MGLLREENSDNRRKNSTFSMAWDGPTPYKLPNLSFFQCVDLFALVQNSVQLLGQFWMQINRLVMERSDTTFLKYAI